MVLESKILYVMGDGRSGSTILGIILGNHSSIECVGELRRWLEFGGYPKPGTEKQSVHAFWEAVRTQYSQSSPLSNIPVLLQAQIIVESFARFPLVLLGLLPASIKETYESHLLKLFDALAMVSQKSVIVDTSKNMGRAYSLLHIARGRVKVIHLVRDPRGVLWSQLKKNIEQDYKSPLKSMFHYSIKNFLSHLVRWVMPKGAILQVRYEDLVNRPLDELRRIGLFIDIPMDGLAERVVNGDPLTIGHLIDGNRIRKQSAIRIRPDHEWQLNLSAGYRFLAVLMTLPFFFLYGYYKHER